MFLSYASQDAEAVRRIAEALRAAGVEVWFDQNELVGGDAWDAKIRGQIANCALFVPVISAATQARLEGYFRVEWKLAARRTHAMATAKAFLLPVVIDGTRDAEAHVPDEFREVQWTRLPGGEAPAAFCARVKKLLGDQGVAVGPVGDRAPDHRSGLQVERRPARPWLVPAIIGAAAVVGLALWQPWRAKEKSETRTPGTVLSSTAADIARLRAGLVPDRWQQSDFAAVSVTLDRLIQNEPENSDAWALRSIINSLQVLRVFDPGTKPLEVGRTGADRALRYAPDSPLAKLALGMHLTAMISRGGDPQAARPVIDGALAVLPPDPLTRYAGLAAVWLGYDFKKTEELAKGWIAAEPASSHPKWIMAARSVTLRQMADVEKWAEQAATDPSFTGVRALSILADAHYYLRADLPKVRATLERLPASARSVPRAAFVQWLDSMAERKWDEALQGLAQLPDAFMFDSTWSGPKAVLAGLAHLRAGRTEAATAQFGEAVRALKEKLATDSENEELRAMLAMSLAYADRPAEARAELALVEPLVKARAPTVYRFKPVIAIAQAYTALGDGPNVAVWLRKQLAEPSGAPFTPASLRIDPRFSEILEKPEIQALLKEFAGLDQPVAGMTTMMPALGDKSVAVLAFANLSDDKANEYFSDGIADELLTTLQKIPGLKVSAHTSAWSFKGKNATSQEIGDKLHVAHIVEGSVQKSGNRVKITARLSRAATNEEIWSKSFGPLELTDVFVTQSELAQAIVAELRGRLGDPAASSEIQAQVQAASRGGTKNVEAHQLYLQGRFFVDQNSVESAIRAAGLLQRAVEIDPQFALGWAELSHAGWMRGAYGAAKVDVEDGFTLARRAAERALALDPQLAAAHLAQADVFDSYDFNWNEARAALNRALALIPDDTNALLHAGGSARTYGRNQEACDLLRRAVELDPVNAQFRGQYAFALNSVGRFKEAEAEFRHVIEISPNAAWGHAGVSLMLSAQERFDEAAAEVVGETPSWSSLFALTIARWGQKKIAESDAALRQLIESYGEVAAVQVAWAYGFRGDGDHAFEWLERSYRQHDSGLGWTRSSPWLNPLHGDPRWKIFLRKVGLADEQLQ